MDNIQLSKCHFCGNEALLNRLMSFDSDANPTQYYVECTYCNAKGPTSTDQNEAIEFWNTPMVDMLFKDILASFPNKHADDEGDPEIMLLNRKVYSSYIQIWYNAHVDNYKLILIYYPKFSSWRKLGNVIDMRDKRSMFYNEFITLTDVIITFQLLMNKMLVDKSMDEISEGLKVYTP